MPEKTLKSCRLIFEEMTTTLTEVEAVLNSRPLTYLSEGDLEEPLTPSHLCYGKRLLSPDTNETKENLAPDRKDMIATTEAVDKTLDCFWKRWSTEYLLDLRSVHKMTVSNAIEPKVGEVVCVHEEGQPRMKWRLGRVIAIISGKDGVTRGAKVRLGERNKRSAVIK